MRKRWGSKFIDILGPKSIGPLRPFIRGEGLLGKSSVPVEKLEAKLALVGLWITLICKDIIPGIGLTR